jgi:Concanavalin A-like lectin/glucanases superfamily/Secretion system C-terminal sorting domain
MMLMKGDLDYVPGTYFLRFSDIITGCTSTPTTTDEQFYGSGVVATTPIVQLDRWYNVVWTFNGTTAKIYVDCNLINSADSAFQPFASNYDLYIGKLNNAQYPYWLNGDLDDIRIYNRALSNEEISALCPSAGTLPIRLSRFETNVISKQIKLNWDVENEEGIIKYTIERSLTGHSDFVALGSVAAKKLTSYSFVDNSATNINQNYYYRLAILQNTNTISYSEVKTARISSGNNIIVLYPNPSKGNIIVRINGYIGTAKFSLINSIGQLVLNKSDVINDNSPLTLRLNGQLKGVYWLKIETLNEQSVEKVVLY